MIASFRTTVTALIIACGLTACGGDTEYLPGEKVVTEVDKPIPTLTQLLPDCELNKECHQFKVLVKESNTSLTFALPINVNARLEIDGGFREPIRDGDLITFNVSGFLSPEMYQVDQMIRRVFF